MTQVYSCQKENMKIETGYLIYDLLIQWLRIHLQCRGQTCLRTWIRIANPMATLCCAEHVHIVQTQTEIHSKGILVRTPVRLPQC